MKLVSPARFLGRRPHVKHLQCPVWKLTVGSPLSGVADCLLASPDTSQQVAPLCGSFNCSRSSKSLWEQWRPVRRGPQLYPSGSQCVADHSSAKSSTDQASATGVMTGLPPSVVAFVWCLWHCCHATRVKTCWGLTAQRDLVCRRKACRRRACRRRACCRGASRKGVEEEDRKILLRAATHGINQTSSRAGALG